MRIIHICDMAFTQGLGANGIITVILALSKVQKKIGNEVKVISISKIGLEAIPDYFIECKTPYLFFKEVRNFNPDIVIFHSFYKYKYLINSYILRLLHIPYFIEFHGGASLANAKKGYLKKKISNVFAFNNFVKNSKGLIYLNEQEKSTSIFSQSKVKSLIIPNGIYKSKDIKKYLPKKKIEIIFLGRIDWIHKGLDYLLDAMRILKNEELDSEVHLSFYGPLENPGLFEENVKSLSSITSYKGFIFGDKKDKVLKEADIYILTSRYEGMPMTVLEALNMGCPCIVTPETNMASLITSKSAGWVTNLNAVDIAKTIKMAVEEFRQHPNELINNAYEAVSSFNWEQISQNSIIAYHDAIKD